jgi:hypothetical protein
MSYLRRTAIFQGQTTRDEHSVGGLRMGQGAVLVQWRLWSMVGDGLGLTGLPNFLSTACKTVKRRIAIDSFYTAFIYFYQ